MASPLKIIVAVDFGTTYSSMAFALSDAKEGITQNMELVEHWGEGAKTGVNVRTILEYDQPLAFGRRPSRWGSEVEMQDYSQGSTYEWFKLALQRGAHDEGLEKEYPAIATEISQSDCEKLITDYLTAMRRNFDRRMRDRGVHGLPREYTITVPAIWNDKAKHLTRLYATKAGMGPRAGVGPKIQIIKEPEAAGLWAFSTMRNLGIQVGETFVLCDAGGGTVDLISYTVRSLTPATLDEASQGTGGLCGSIYLNRKFSRYLDQKFSGYPFFNEAFRTFMMDAFETDIKKGFMGDINREFYIKGIHGINDARHLGISNGRFSIPGQDLKWIFSEVIASVINLVTAQVRATNRSVKKVLLAGGFGKNLYLKNELQKAMNRDHQKLEVEQIFNSDEAVVRGALLTGFARVDKNPVHARAASRIATKSYGILKLDRFDARKGHDRTRISEEWAFVENKVEVVDWFIKQGETIEESKKKRVPLTCKEDNDGSFKPLPIEVFAHHALSGEAPPVHKTEGVISVVNLTARLDIIPKPRLYQRVDEWGDKCSWADFDIETTLNAAGTLSFNLLHAGESAREESVEMDFV